MRHLRISPSSTWLLRPPRGRGALVLPLALSLAGPLSAQTIEGRLVDAATEQPIAAAVAVLLAETGATVAGTLSDDHGRFVLRAPGPGAYRVRVERIGYESHTSEGIALAAGETRPYRMAVAARAISLEGITARGDRRCRVRPEQGLATARVWEEARKALAASALAQRERLFRFGVTIFDRVLAADGQEVTRERTESRSGFHAQPFVSVEVETLAARGFVHEVAGGQFYDYFAPDAEVLLSDAFLDTHCMRLAAGSGARAGQVGLAFRPLRGREVPEIEGTLWLDEESAVLRELEFRYVHLPWPISSDQVGGRVGFARLPNGSIVVRHWSIRMPQIELVSGSWRGTRRQEYRIRGFREKGGEVVRVQTAAGEVVEIAGPPVGRASGSSLR